MVGQSRIHEPEAGGFIIIDRLSNGQTVPADWMWSLTLLGRCHKRWTLDADAGVDPRGPCQRKGNWGVNG